MKPPLKIAFHYQGGSFMGLGAASKFPYLPRRRRLPRARFYCALGGWGYVFMGQGSSRKAVLVITDGPQVRPAVP